MIADIRYQQLPALQQALSFGVRCLSGQRVRPISSSFVIDAAPCKGMSNLNSKQVTMIIDELESVFQPNPSRKIYSHEDLPADTLQEIVGMNYHETIYQNIDRVIWDYQSGVTFVIAPKGRITGMRGSKA